MSDTRDISHISRRAALRGIVGGLSALSCLNVPRGLHANLTSQFRVGIIGATGRGNYGHALDVAFTKLASMRIVAVADADATGLQDAAKRLNPERTYADYREMLSQESLDIVAICPRWIDQHHAMLIAAADAGCHVYMEKPFCRSLVECDEVVRLFQQKHLKLAIAHISQYSPVLPRVQTLLTEGIIGDLLELRARGKEDARGGGEDLWVLGSHVLGLMRSLAGGDALACSAEVYDKGELARRESIVQGAEGIGPLLGDAIHARFRFGRGLQGYFASQRSTAGTPSRFAVQVHGSKGILEMETGYLVPASLLRDSSWSPRRSGKGWETITSAGIGINEPRTDAGYEAGHIAAINDLVDCIQLGGEPKCSALDGTKIIEMISAIYAAHLSQTSVALPLADRHNPLGE